jgi:ABC-2 type transport system ATP-binding protein
VILAENLTKNYGSRRAVDHLSLSIERGETYALLGPNGAGKSTTISMLVGLLAPDSGHVLVDGRSPREKKTQCRIGLAPQSLALYDELTAREHIQFFSQLYGKKARVSECLEFAGLNDRATSRVSTFSGGMKRRLNIAVALIHEPDILLLDEPTVGVDPQSRNHIFDCIDQLKSKGMTILYTTHYMEEVERLCDRVAIMDHGKLLAVDSIPNLLSQYGGDSKVTAELKSIPTNVDLPGVRHDLQLCFDSHQPLEETLELSRAGVEFQSVTISQPDLESVFLSLTGRSLRD